MFSVQVSVFRYMSTWNLRGAGNCFYYTNLGDRDLQRAVGLCVQRVDFVRVDVQVYNRFLDHTGFDLSTLIQLV